MLGLITLKQCWKFLLFSFKLDPFEEINHCMQKLIYVCDQLGEREELQQKVTFLTEQLRLLGSKPNSRRYSTSFLWSCLKWMKTSPALYKVLLHEQLITMPSIGYLKEISSAFSLQSGLSPATLAYLQERVKPLAPQEKIVSLLIDEVCFTHCSNTYIFESPAFSTINYLPTLCTKMWPNLFLLQIST